MTYPDQGTDQNLSGGSEGSGEASGSEVSSSPVETISPSGGESGVNPAWQPFLSDLPEYFHPKAQEHFKKWDDNYRNLETQHRELSEKYKPYEPYLGVDPANLNNAWSIFQTINDDPMRVYNLLAQHVKELGLLPPDAKPEAKPETPEFMENEDPKYQELAERQRVLDERQAKMDEYVQQQTYNAQVQTYEQKIDEQVQGLVTKYGSAVDIQDVLGRMFNQASAGKQLDAEAAFQEQKATFQRLYKAQNGGRPAPTIIPTNGTPAPSGDKKPEDMNEEETKAHFKHLWEIANAGG